MYQYIEEYTMDKATVIRLQKAIGATVDGSIGEGTLTAVFRKCGASAKRASLLGRAANVYLNQFGILDHPLIFAHFLAQACHETGYFKWLEETASGEAYNGRIDLGNTSPGDGPRFKGRGVFMITGRSNYILYSKRTGIELESRPERASEEDISIIIACHYWKNKGLSDLALADNVDKITYKINGGYVGFEERKAALVKIKSWLGITVA